MIYPRLKRAHTLLRDDGAIFASIDDNGVTSLRKALDEIFGEANFVAQLVWAAGRKNDSQFISVSHEYIVVYAKNKQVLKEKQITWRTRKSGLDEIYATYRGLKKTHGDDYAGLVEV